ncbi:Fic family protein, partial [Pseudomonas cannabina]|uniref:Fic family protein n=1 Tax=Pseudomonas cannabina TaxID=86840 RepID=UPI00160514F4
MDRILRCMSAADPREAKYLDLEGLDLEELPPGLEKCLPGLESLNLSGCDLARLPESLGELPALRAIDLTGNMALRDLPASLDISKMEIKTLDTQIVALGRIRPPLTIRDAGAAEQLQARLESIKDYWTACQDMLEDRPESRLQVEQVVNELRLAPSSTVARGLEASDLVQLNWRNAARIVDGWIEDDLDRLRPKHLLELNQAIGADTVHSSRYGHFRSVAVGLPSAERNGRGYFVPPRAVLRELDDLLEWLHENDRNLAAEDLLGQLALAAAAYKNLVSIHPFEDGNGRTTRLVMDWMLQRRGLPPAIVPGPRALHMKEP